MKIVDRPEIGARVDLTDQERTDLAEAQRELNWPALPTIPERERVERQARHLAVLRRILSAHGLESHQVSLSWESDGPVLRVVLPSRPES